MRQKIFMNKEIPEMLIQAQELQKAGDYTYSRRLYKEFFESNNTHPLRFKALFEVADNYYHAKDYKSAKKAYLDFLEYCSDQENTAEEEYGWIDAYTRLTKSRLEMIEHITIKQNGNM